MVNIKKYGYKTAFYVSVVVSIFYLIISIVIYNTLDEMIGVWRIKYEKIKSDYDELNALSLKVADKYKNLEKDYKELDSQSKQLAELCQERVKELTDCRQQLSVCQRQPVSQSQPSELDQLMQLFKLFSLFG
ncbi:MAG: hypothetical protein HYW23_04735 [Candidatus Aenigmarchaeota archaeon]|nr:hypothetical protein [Candidatus Aenigmarchaeota archaeon]